MQDDRRAHRVLELIRALAGPGAPTPRTDTTLGSLGMDSLSFAELAAAVEETLGASLTDSVLDGSATVGDVVEATRASQPKDSDEAPHGMGRLQGAARLVAGWPLGWWTGLRVVGADRVPGRGPVILAMNHESALDIPIVVTACPRPIAFMAKRELFASAFTAWSLHELGAFRVDRDRFDVRATAVALAVLGRGYVLGMYPEGTRSPGELLPFLPGAAWLALRSGAPLVPVAITGTDRVRDARRPRRARVRVTFVEPLTVQRVDEPQERRRRSEALTTQLRSAIQAHLGS